VQRQDRPLLADDPDAIWHPLADKHDGVVRLKYRVRAVERPVVAMEDVGGGGVARHQNKDAVQLRRMKLIRRLGLRPLPRLQTCRVCGPRPEFRTCDSAATSPVVGRLVADRKLRSLNGRLGPDTRNVPHRVSKSRDRELDKRALPSAVVRGRRASGLLAGCGYARPWLTSLAGRRGSTSRGRA
jgi:hypothetical protein